MKSTYELEETDVLKFLGVFYAVSRSIIAILGVVGNGLVIWITGFKIKKSVDSTWYLSLAVSDFLFCATLPFYVIYIIKNDWIFGRFMCKFVLFFFHFNMFSSIFLLTVISLDRCIVVMFPVWVHNMRTISKAWAMVVIAWVVSAALSMPGAFSQKYLPNNNSSYGDCSFKFKGFKSIFLSQFCFGFTIPFLIIVVCSVLIMRKLRTNQMVRSTKPFKVMTVIIVAFFICWLPYHIFNLVGINITNKDKYFYLSKTIISTLAYANSFLNPFFYAFMGKDVKGTCYSVLAKIESAIKEEYQHNIHLMSVKTTIKHSLNLKPNA